MFDVCEYRDRLCYPQMCRGCRRGHIHDDRKDRLSREDWESIYFSVVPRKGALREAWERAADKPELLHGECPCETIGISCQYCPDRVSLTLPCLAGRVWSSFAARYPISAYKAVIRYLRGEAP